VSLTGVFESAKMAEVSVKPRCGPTDHRRAFSDRSS